MYLRPETIVLEWQAVEQFLTGHSLGLLTTAIPLSGQPTIQASHLPFLYTPPSDLPSSPTPTTTTSVTPSAAVASREGTWSNANTNTDLGTLRCHLARSNPQAKALSSLSPDALAKEEVLIVFSDPTNSQGYISPSWYAQTKPETGKVVPTWNYTELQLYGHITLSSPHDIVRELSEKHEKEVASKQGKDEEKVWRVSDAPEKYIDLLEKVIVGVEINVSRVGYKVKMSKEKSDGDREGVVEGLTSVGAEEVAKIVQKAV